MRLVIWSVTATPIGGPLSPRNCHVRLTATKSGGAIGRLLDAGAITVAAKRKNFIVQPTPTSLIIRPQHPLRSPGAFFKSTRRLVLDVEAHNGADQELVFVEEAALHNTGDLSAVAQKLCLVLRYNEYLKRWIVRVDGWEGHLASVLNTRGVQTALGGSPFSQDLSAGTFELWVQARPQQGTQEQVGRRLGQLLMPLLRVPNGKNRRSFRIARG